MGGERKCKGSVKEERGRGEREKESREKREKKERFWIPDDTGNLSMHVFTTHLTDGSEPVHEVVQLLLL